MSEQEQEATTEEQTVSTPPPPKFNKQLYRNSGLKELFELEKSASAAADADSERSNPLSQLFNAKEPNLAIKHEKPEHRLLLYMKAQGMSTTEIAEQSGYTISWLSQLFRQPWAQERLLQILNETGKDRVQTLLKAAAEDSVMTLIDLRDDAEVPASVRRSAADSLLDRYLGKPHQHVEVVQSPAKSADDIMALDREIEVLQQEENRLLGKGHS